MYNKKTIIDALRNLGNPTVPKKTAASEFEMGQEDDNWISAQNGVETPIYKKVKVAPSSIEGKGLFAEEPIKQGDVIGVSHIRQEFEKGGETYTAPFPSTVLGYYNHSEDPNVKEEDQGSHILMVAIKDIQPGEEITSDYNNHNIEDLETPDNFKKGGTKKPKIPKKKNSSAYSRSLEATNRLFAEHPLFEKPRSRKNKIYDPLSKYYANGGTANYIEVSLTPKEIEEYAKGGYIIEDISVPELTKAQKGKIVTPLYIENPLEYKFRKAAYNDSLSEYNDARKFALLSERDPRPFGTANLNWKKIGFTSYDKAPKVISKKETFEYKNKNIPFSIKETKKLLKAGKDPYEDPRGKTKDLFFKSNKIKPVGFDIYTNPVTNETIYSSVFKKPVQPVKYAGKIKLDERYIGTAIPRNYPKAKPVVQEDNSITPLKPKGFENINTPEKLEMPVFPPAQPKKDIRTVSRLQTVMELDPNNPGRYKVKELRSVPYSAYFEGEGWQPLTAPGLVWIDEQGNEVSTDPRKVQGPVASFQDGGEYFKLNLTPKEIEQYVKGGYIVEDISVPSLTKASLGKIVKPVLQPIKPIVREVIRSNYNPITYPLKSLAEGIAKQSSGASRSPEQLKNYFFTKEGRVPTYFGTMQEPDFWEGEPILGNWEYGIGKRDLLANYFRGIDKGFEPIDYDFSADPGLESVIQEYGPLKAFKLNSQIQHGEPIDIFSLRIGNLGLEKYGLPQGTHSLFGDQFIIDPTTGSKRYIHNFLPGNLNIFRNKYPGLLDEASAITKNRLNSFFDLYGQDTIPFELNYKPGYQPLFGMLSNPVKPIDDIAGHMVFLRRNADKEFDLTTRDLWGFRPQAYNQKYDINSFMKRKQSQLVDVLGKPFVLTQTNPIRFKKGGTPGESEYQLGDEVDEATMKKLKELGYTFQMAK